MLKLSFFLAFTAAMLISIVSHGQNNVFFDQVKAMLEQGKVKQFSDFKGAFVKTDVAGQKTYECSFKLDGFETRILEVKGKLEFMATSVSYSKVNNNMKFLLTDMVRDMEGLPGYKNQDSPSGHFESVVILMKPGSDVKLLIFKLKDNEGYTLMTSTFKSVK